MKTVKIVDACGRLVATACVDEREDLLAGDVDLNPMPADLRRKFDEYEAIVNEQTFSLLDEIEGEIEALRLSAVLPGGARLPIEDLQVYPSTGRVTFRIASEATPSTPRT